jgi:hypothetical protein
MCQRLLSDDNFFLVLVHCDEDMAATCREEGCPYCEDVLHSARYPRKPRGACGALGDEYGYRFSFCCAADDCRRRTTPPSVRFLGRRVYLGAVVVLASVLLHGASAKRVARLQELIGVDRRTLERWRAWWQAEFPRSTWWQRTRGELAEPADEARLPQSLLECFGGNDADRLLAVLRVMAPITTSSVVRSCAT